MKFYFEINDSTEDYVEKERKGFICSDFKEAINEVSKLNFGFRPDSNLNLKRSSIDSIKSILNGKTKGSPLYNSDDNFITYGKVNFDYYDERGFFVRTFKVYSALGDTIEEHLNKFKEIKVRKFKNKISDAVLRGNDFYKDVCAKRDEYSINKKARYCVAIKGITLAVQGLGSFNDHYISIINADSKLEAFCKAKRELNDNLISRYGEDLEYAGIPDFWFNSVTIEEWN